MPLSVISMPVNGCITACRWPIVVADRHRQRAGHVLQQVDAEVLLQIRDAAVHPRLQPLALLLRRSALRWCRRRAGRDRGTCRRASASTARPSLAGQIHQRHLDAAHAAGLPRVAAELLDLAEDLVDVAGVLAEDAALEHQRVGLAGAVAHFAVADQALVGVDADQRTGHRRADDDRDAQVGDLQLRRLRRRLDVLRERVERRRR